MKKQTSKSRRASAARKNAHRARRAFFTLDFYKKRQLIEAGKTDIGDTLIDLLTDLRHLCSANDRFQTTFDDAVEASATHFTVEQMEAAPPPPPRVPSKSAVTTSRLLNPPPK